MAYSLTERQKNLLKYIDTYITENEGVGPTLQEMTEGMGLNSKSNTHRLLDILEIKGYIRRLKWTARAIEVLSVPICVRK
jgi:repressor LexA